MISGLEDSSFCIEAGETWLEKRKEGVSGLEVETVEICIYISRNLP